MCEWKFFDWRLLKKHQIKYNFERSHTKMRLFFCRIRNTFTFYSYVSPHYTYTPHAMLNWTKKSLKNQSTLGTFFVSILTAITFFVAIPNSRLLMNFQLYIFIFVDFEANRHKLGPDRECQEIASITYDQGLSITWVNCLVMTLSYHIIKDHLHFHWKAVFTLYH